MQNIKTRITPKDILIMLVQWSFLAAIRIILFLMGLVIVPIALLFAEEHPDTRRSYSQFNRNCYWQLVTLPRWAWLWSNDRDGAMGDKRGWWDRECGNARSFKCMFKWLALRNPVHNTTFTRLSCNVCKVSVILIGGSTELDFKDIEDGWQLLKTSGNRFPCYHLYVVKPKWGLYINIGHKIKLKHSNQFIVLMDSPQKCWKKFTFRVRIKK